jgi:hypothetical protein
LPQIVRNGVTLHGRLAYKLSVGVTPNPRWLVTFDDHPHKDEELYEKAFGELIKAADKESAPVGRLPRRSRSSISSNSSLQSRRTQRSSGSSEELEKDEERRGEGRNDETKKDNRSVSFSKDALSAECDSSTTLVRKGAREQRSLRRQAKIDTDVIPPLSEASSHHSARKRRLPPPKHSNKRVKLDNAENVVKVHLLTGTLYLYRGLHRRAEFVRRI